jgi:uncharacterized oligopeptide transporter (OPT) family protein
MKETQEKPTGLPENAFRPLKPGEKYEPLMSPGKTYPEVNFWSVTWGLVMAVIFSAAAAYLGLKVGQVFEAAIPIAIIAVGISSATKRKGALGENVMIQSIGACSGVIVAGAIFTLPALYILQEKYPEMTVNFMQMFISSLLGGVLGILFLIPFRKYFVKDKHGEYPFPEATAKIYQQYRDSTGVKDSAKVEAAVRKIIKDKAHAKYVRDHKQIWNKNTGKPIAKGEFMNWTDKTTSRSQTLVENFFGESIMLHQQNLLGDVLRNRPVIVKYQSAVNYVVEACIVVLFLLGILAGRKSKFLWLTLTFFLMDAALHIGLGFGINEVYIMTAHYMYALPIAIAFLALKAKGKNLKWAFRGLMLAITLYLWISNGYLLVGYMLG